MTSEQYRNKFDRIWRFVEITKLSALLKFQEEIGADLLLNPTSFYESLDQEEQRALREREMRMLEPYGFHKISSRDTKILYFLSMGKSYDEVSKIFGINKGRVALLVNRLKQVIARSKFTKLEWMD